MPITRCTYCDSVTNSAVSNYWLDTEIDGKTPKEIERATRCFAAVVDGKWVEGCAYKHIDEGTKVLIDKLLTEEGV